MQLNQKALGLALGVLGGLVWAGMMAVSLLLGIGARTVTAIGSFHPFFSYSWLGLVMMAIEHLVCGFVVGWFFAGLYNKFASKNQPSA